MTLIEVLVGPIIALIALAAITWMLLIAMSNTTLLQTRTEQLSTAQAAMQRLVRELRQATSVTVVSSSSITYSEPTSAGTETVTFSCSSSTAKCTRTAAGSSITEVTNVANSDIFSGSPSSSSPTYVAIKLVLSASGQTSVTLTDGANVRNSTIGT